MSVDEQNCTGVSTVTAFICLAYHLKEHSLTGQQLSCTPHKDSAGALYS